MLSRILALVCGLAGCSRQGPPNVYTAADHNRLYEEGCDLIKPYMRFHDRPRDPTLTRMARKELSQGIKLLQAVIKINPTNWAAYWVIGKAYQSLGQSEEACEAFGQSFALQKHNADVAREYMTECLNLGRAKEGIDAAEHAVGMQPNDAGLVANLALAYLIAGRNDEALEKAEGALALDPTDTVTQAVVRVIREVTSGKRPQPKRLKDVEGS